ncbi:type II secretion system protein C (GspC) [Marinobacter daqiaonensis]|uniref:Type II secretion system protein C (GspC) n=1 Tax=Marinobacter daqiaonensis TaxID=650891 RepID=A0A1I6JEV3_9GAMM|nr:type II secretion system protein N [Marinobacter daqiaonensis]SFR77553.1 type II secretion system protein C (GspC) [Marinobacter daqiaonensis]
MGRRGKSSVPAWIPRWLANSLLIGLVLYLALGAAWLTWFLLWEETPVASVYGAQGVGSGPDAGVQAPLASFELFGRPAGNQPVAETVRRNAPETRLRLRLEGVLVAEKPENSGAIVTSGGNTTAHYRVGEMIPGNAELVEVEPGRILIRRQGAYESLTFEEDYSDAGLAEAEPAENAGERMPSTDDFLAQAQARLDSEGANALLAFGLRPVDDGGSQGYVFDGSNAMLRAVNLRQGDVITAINGYPLGDLEQDRQLLETLRSESQLQVEVERDGARFTVTYALPQ